jgi:hypothetical protein
LESLLERVLEEKIQDQKQRIVVDMGRKQTVDIVQLVRVKKYKAGRQGNPKRKVRKPLRGRKRIAK